MIQINPIFNLSIALLSILTVFGVAVHDTSVDKAIVAAAAPITYVDNHDLHKGDHTHSERTSMARFARDIQNSSNTRMQPRRDYDRTDSNVKKVARDFYSEKSSHELVISPVL